jgi:FkbM family methyltransferase
VATPRVIYRRVRRAVWRALGRDIRFAAQTAVPAERHGSEYGGWWICPSGLRPDSIVYSIGIGDDITFDLSLIKAHGVTIHAFDPTPRSIAYLKSQPLPSAFKWHQLGIGGRDGTARFFPPENPAHISHTLVSRAQTEDRAIEVDVRRLSTVMSELCHHTIDVLKMDIEGAEYDVLDEIVERRLPVQQILVEFHHRFPEIGVERTRRAVHDLNAAGYRIFFASESGEEYSFIADSRRR